MKKFIGFLFFLCIFTACNVANPQNENAQPSTPDLGEITSSTGYNYATSIDSTRMDTSDFDVHNVECPTCIDPPGDEGGGTTECTVPDDYTLRAGISNSTLSTVTSDVPTWRLSPFWGGIIQSVLPQL